MSVNNYGIGNTRGVAARKTEQKERGEVPHEQDIMNVLQKHRQRQAERTSARVAAFHERKKSLYALARKQAKDISTSGLAYIEEMQINYWQLREQEKSFEKFVEDYTSLKRSQEGALSTLPELCDELVDELSLRRTSQVDSACEMVKNAPESRQEALKSGLKRARRELERVKEAEKITSDAAEMIGYYKGLLRASSSDA